MQTTLGNRYMNMKRTASTAARREGIRAALAAAMTGGAGLLVLALLFLASVGYVVFGGAFEVAAAPEAQSRIAAVAAKPTAARGGLRNYGGGLRN